MLNIQFLRGGKDWISWWSVACNYHLLGEFMTILNGHVLWIKWLHKIVLGDKNALPD